MRLLSLLFFLALSAFPQSESDKEFIELYLKIQALEKEIALLRNEVEVLEAHELPALQLHCAIELSPFLRLVFLGKAQ